MSYLKDLIKQYEKTCDLIHHFENYEPDQLELEQARWRMLARESVENLRYIRQSLKDDIIWALDNDQ